MKLKDPFYFLVISLTVIFLLAIYLSERLRVNVEPFGGKNPILSDILEDANLSNSDCTAQDDNGETRYLAYLPHGTFHEQRTSLENAIFLAWATNRTLLLPPIIFGRKILAYEPSYYLYKDLITLKLYDENNNQCVWDSEHEKCARQVQPELHTLVDWEVLMDMEFPKKHIRSVPRESFKFSSLYSTIDLTDPNNQIYFISDKGPYDYQFYDDVNGNKTSESKYEYMIHLCTIQKRNEPLLHFGSLSGVDRLNLKLERNKRFLKELQGHMLISHPGVLNAAELITTQLGGLTSYLGVHIGSSDYTSNDRVEFMVNNLIKEIMGKLTNASPSESNNDTLSARDSSFQPTSTQVLASNCMESLPPEKKHLPIIYLSTNLTRSDHGLSKFLEEFPCVFMLPDFQRWTESLKNIVNPRDDVDIYEFLLPLVDTTVVAGGGQLFETEDDAFNSYVQRLHEIWM
ncbi:16757_t:CDS:1 [Acaulospora colombiana]|uniref:16757_t:CDS:1 n=1 Tax=Acaulospora colombiana TaxID=27376 RepID=A0ACA9K9I0_9GLOM|nr:16757_t:CDS:1 [Acaulospora colombiana]